MNNYRCPHCGTSYGPDVVGCRCAGYLSYTWAMKRVEELLDLDPEPNTEEGRELTALATELEKYEREVLKLWPDP